MKVEIRCMEKRTGIECSYIAHMLIKPNFMEAFFFDRRLRKAIHRWGNGWNWEDTNKPCPYWLEQKLNRELNKEVTNVH